ncbi:acetyl-CoA synthetase-like protein [Amniculicola lignicola CBS 123094]|uniref:Very long-chain fatty acid transport protein n=1 Tax=Amniculicola lignicola CBS 123094 TaxID=1392246 RepID=A0A6A5WAZ2_9PLEO|nr:acetyl-CoA synthetase-like protein [Amniculicola lignicola CBS 123094]
MAAASAAAVAGMSALAAYVNAKYHINQDLKVIRRRKQAVKWYEELAKQNRLSHWYPFALHASRYSHELCIWSRTKTYTWQQTLNLAVQWAHYFLSQGVKPGDMVATYLMNSADFLVIWLGLWCIGCAPAMPNYNLKGESLMHCLRVSGANIVLVDGDVECKERFEGIRSEAEKELGIAVLVVDDRLVGEVMKKPTNAPGDEYRAGVTASSPTCLLYTSGTTGLPKAGMFTVGRLHERGNPESLAFDQKPGPNGDRWYCCMPIFHGTGGMSCLIALTSGLSVAVGRKFSVSTFWNDIHDSDSTIFVYVGEAARYLLMAPPHPYEKDHPRLRAMYGNGMRPDVWPRFKERFNVPEVIEFFNSTEGVFALVVHNKGPFTDSCVGQHGLILRQALKNTYIPVGVDAETGAIIRNPDTGLAERKPYIEGGEMLVNIPAESAFSGYYNNPSATAKKFERNVFKKGDLFYRSGDALRRDDDGRWFFVDRLGDTYRWKSENVSTAEVAEVLGNYPGITEANVYGVLVPRHDGRAGCVALRFSDGVNAETFDFASLLAYARDKLPKYAVPIFVRLAHESSTTDNNKQNKAPLREEGIELGKYGSRMVEGKDDIVLWVRPGSDRYERFDLSSLGALRSGKVVL